MTPSRKESASHERFEAIIEQFDAGNQVDDLAQFVMRAAHEAANHKRSSGVQGRMEASRRAVLNQYDPQDLELLDHNAVYMGLTNLKVRAFKSWVSDILLNAEERPFTVRPSPIPDLPRAAEDMVIDIFMREVQEAGFAPSSTAGVETRLSQLKQVAKSHIARVTEAAASNLEDAIHDQLTQGNWREAMNEFIDDLGSMPGAVLKGPHVEFSPRLKWDAYSPKATVVKEARYRVSRVSPFDLYPSPDARSVQSGRYVIERTRMGQSQLMDAISLEGFREAAIRSVIADSPSGWTWDETMMAAPMDDAEVSQHRVTALSDAGSGADSRSHGGLYDVLVYYGQVTGHMLYDLMNAADAEKLDVQGVFEAEVWVANNTVIRAILNPHPTGRRPFYVTSFDKRPGAFWGNGLPDLLRDVQRVGNATIRALVKNMAFSSGPIGEADMSRLSGEDDITEVQPFRIYQVDNDAMLPSAQPALRFHQALSNSRELMSIYESFMKQADDISGIPAYVLGNPQVAGAGRTLGGLSLLMGNAAKGIKKVINQVDKDIIEPVIEQYAMFNMMFSDNPDLKFDTFIVARGSTGLLQKELSQSRAIELLGILAPFAQQGIVPPAGLEIVMRDVIRGLGYRADEIVPDPSRKNEIGNFLDSANGVGNSVQTTTAPGTPQPALDGRSSAALAVQ